MQTQEDRLVPVRIADVPLATRLSAAQRACRQEKDARERERIFGLAMFPGSLVAYVRAEQLKVAGL